MPTSWAATPIMYFGVESIRAHAPARGAGSAGASCECAAFGWGSRGGPALRLPGSCTWESSPWSGGSGLGQQVGARILAVERGKLLERLALRLRELLGDDDP